MFTRTAQERHKGQFWIQRDPWAAIKGERAGRLDSFTGVTKPGSARKETSGIQGAPRVSPRVSPRLSPRVPPNPSWQELGSTTYNVKSFNSTNLKTCLFKCISQSRSCAGIPAGHARCYVTRPLQATWAPAMPRHRIICARCSFQRLEESEPFSGWGNHQIRALRMKSTKRQKAKQGLPMRHDIVSASRPLLLLATKAGGPKHWGLHENI